MKPLKLPVSGASKCRAIQNDYIWSIKAIVVGLVARVLLDHAGRTELLVRLYHGGPSYRRRARQAVGRPERRTRCGHRERYAN